ncbi:MAG: dihydrofolate reductase [Lachnospiraceae bacterium]
MNMIVAADKNWGIGYRNRLLVSIPEDMKFFRSATEGNVVVMGRKTLESFPGGRPLGNRTNIVLTKNQDYRVRGAVVCHSLEEVLKELEAYPSEKVYVIGGSSIYEQFLPLCNVAHVTKIDHAYEADAYFPDIDRMPEWTLTGESEEKTYFDLEFTFCRYERLEA